MNERKREVRPRPARMIFKGAFIFNPVLTQAIGICPIVAIAYTVRSAVALSAVLAVLLLLCEYLSAFLLHKLPRWLRVAVYLTFSTAVLAAVMPSLDIIAPQTSSALGVYLPLLAVNSLVVVRCETFAVKSAAKMKKHQAVIYCLADSVSACLGYAAVIILVAFIRSQLIAGKLLGIGSGFFPPVTAMTMPFGGLVVLAFVAALHKRIILRFFPDEPTDTFEFTAALKMPLLHDPGLKARETVTKLINEPYTGRDTMRIKGLNVEKNKAELYIPNEFFTDPFEEYIPDESEFIERRGRDFTDEDVDYVAIPVDEDEQGGEPQ